jgi:hypothetical protein
MVIKPYLLPPSKTALPDNKDVNIKPLFQKLVGSLIYLVISTRPDISYPAMALGQFNANPTCAHLVAGKCVLRYVAGTLDLALEFNFEASFLPPLVVLYGIALCLTLIGLQMNLTGRVFLAIAFIFSTASYR